METKKHRGPSKGTTEKYALFIKAIYDLTQQPAILNTVELSKQYGVTTQIIPLLIRLEYLKAHGKEGNKLLYLWTNGEPSLKVAEYIRSRIAQITADKRQKAAQSKPLTEKEIQKKLLSVGLIYPTGFLARLILWALRRPEPKPAKRLRWRNPFYFGVVLILLMVSCQKEPPEKGTCWSCEFQQQKWMECDKTASQIEDLKRQYNTPTDSLTCKYVFNLIINP